MTETTASAGAKSPAPEPSAPPKRQPTPKELCRELDKYVIGQQMAKKTFAVGVHNHMKRVQLRQSADMADVTVEKSNVLMAGPTGAGKTLLVKTLARMLDVPFVIVDATSYTSMGYVGDDVELILTKLLVEAQGDVERAEQGIVYIDEVDKLCSRLSGVKARDIGGEGVQQALLKLLEGSVVNVPDRVKGRRDMRAEMVPIRTDDILFIAGGAFAGVEDIVQERISRRSLGFGNEVRASKPEAGAAGGPLPCQLLVEKRDIENYGFIPEFLGRFAVVVALAELTEAELTRVLTEPRGAIIKQYESLFSASGVELSFAEDAVTAVAAEAARMNLGARGLRTVIERVLLEPTFALDETTVGSRLQITAEVVRGEADHHFELRPKAEEEEEDTAAAAVAGAAQDEG